MITPLIDHIQKKRGYLMPLVPPLRPTTAFSLGQTDLIPSEVYTVHPKSVREGTRPSHTPVARNIHIRRRHLCYCL